MAEAPDLRLLTHARDLIGGAVPGPEADRIATQLVDLNAGAVTIDNRDTGERIDYFLLKGAVTCRVEASILPPQASEDEHQQRRPLGKLFHQVEIVEIDGLSVNGGSA